MYFHVFSHTDLNSVNSGLPFVGYWPLQSVCLIRKKWCKVVSTDQWSCHPIRRVEHEASKARTKVDPWGGEKQETKRGLLSTFLSCKSKYSKTWGCSCWLVRRYLQDNQVEEWNYAACTGCFCKASWKLIGRKIRREWKGRDRPPVDVFEGIFFVFLCLSAS